MTGRLAAAAALVFAVFAGFARGETLVVASKNFNENYILGEIVAQVLEAEGYEVERKLGLGGTLICYDALANDEVDVYVEYTGTLSQAILRSDRELDLRELTAALAEDGLLLLEPFGFNNTYAMTVRRELAEARGLRQVSDLLGHDDLDMVVSHEFLERDDGWPGLAAEYGFTGTPRGIEHGLAYQALADGAIDVTDAYSTDGELERYDLKVLEDDRGFFPSYLAAPLARRTLPSRAREALARLGGTLTAEQMSAMNAAVLFRGETFESVARAYVADVGYQPAAGSTGSTLLSELGRNTLRHLQLTAIALSLAVVFGVVLALLIFRSPWLSKSVVYIAGLLQTIPSIALLALMIPLLGIGQTPAIVALFLYSLLPILRNTVTALTTIDPVLKRVAIAMGLTRFEEVRYVYVPLAMPSMFAGIRTAAVISIGTATLAAFIGAGGLGDPIVTGLALNDSGLILRGALPAAGLAIVTELLFEGLERWVVPKHLQ